MDFPQNPTIYKKIEEIMENNYNLFVCAHKEFGCRLTNPNYTILCGKNDDIKADVPIVHIDDELANLGFSEWQKFYHIWKHMEVKDYVGLMHYRRVLLLGDDINNIPPMEDLFKDCDIIVGEVLRTNIYQHYNGCHNIQDLDDCIGIIKSDYPEYAEACDRAIHGNRFIICNTCLLKKEDFYDLCEFMFGVLFKFCEKNGIDPSSDDSFRAHKDKLPKKNEYQTRSAAYLSERLFNVWVEKHQFRIKSVKVVDGGIGNR